MGKRMLVLSAALSAMLGAWVFQAGAEDKAPIASKPATATSGAVMIVSDRTLKDMNDAKAAQMEEWKKESAAAGSRFKTGSYTDVNGQVFKYALTLPVKVESGVKYPLFMGMGVNHTLAMGSSQAQYPCYVFSVYVPQTLLTPNAKGGYTYDADYKSVVASAYKAVIDKIVSENPSVDASRISIEGASKFGAMAWITAYNYPDTIAAVIPSVAGYDISKTLQVGSRKIGIWMFYGVLDGGPVDAALAKAPHGRGSPHQYKALRDVGYDCMYTVYTHGDHNEYGFTDSLTNPEWNDFTRMRKWLFEQKKPTAAWPVINSPGTALGTVGTPFTYTITANNEPKSFSAVLSIEHAEKEDGTITEPKEPLPAGLSLDPKSGVISGTPKEAGRSFIRLNATNDKGTGITTLQLVVKGDAPATGPAAKTEK